MNIEMNITDYLSQGGVLTSPGNVPPRYRAELLRMMASFVDSELAGAAGFADIINLGPGLKERIAAARIVMEKFDHADRVLGLMGEFGADVERYANDKAWTDRLERDAPVGAERVNNDMRLAVFNYPLDGWADAVVMNLLMGCAVRVQLSEYESISYQPLAQTIRDIAPREADHLRLASEGVEKLISSGTDKAELEASVVYWWPRVLSSFGSETSNRFVILSAMGLRSLNNTALRERFLASASEALKACGLSAPA